MGWSAVSDCGITYQTHLLFNHFTTIRGMIILLSYEGLYFGPPGNETFTITFNIIFLQGNAHCPSLFELSCPFKIEGFFLAQKYSFTASITPSLLHTVFHEDEISVLGTDRSQKEPYQENMGDKERFHILIQSQQSWSRTPHVSFSRPFLAIFWCSRLNSLHNKHRLLCDLAQDNQS